MNGLLYPSEVTATNKISRDDNSPLGWYMTSVDPRDEPGIESYWTTREGNPLVFVRKMDCQIACDSFNKLGATHKYMEEVSDDEMRRIACENLPW